MILFQVQKINLHNELQERTDKIFNNKFDWICTTDAVLSFFCKQHNVMLAIAFLQSQSRGTTRAEAIQNSALKMSKKICTFDFHEKERGCDCKIDPIGMPLHVDFSNWQEEDGKELLNAFNIGTVEELAILVFKKNEP